MRKKHKRELEILWSKTLRELLQKKNKNKTKQK